MEKLISVTAVFVTQALFVLMSIVFFCTANVYAGTRGLLDPNCLLPTIVSFVLAVTAHAMRDLYEF